MWLPMHYPEGMYYSLLLDARLLSFEQLKDLYEHDSDFGKIFRNCTKHGFNKFYIFEGYLFRGNQLCMPNRSIKELLVS